MSEVLGTGAAYAGFTGGTGYTTVTDPEEAVTYWSHSELPTSLADK